MNNITAKGLKDKNSQAIPKKKNFLSNNFWYYTRYETLKKILSSGFIHISNISGMNDLDERSFHKKSADHVFCLCMSNSTAEKIPMLYLYSGIDGKGAAIKFKPTVMSELLRSFFNKTMVYTLDDRGLKLGVDYELKFGWVYYQNRSAKSRVKYKGDWYQITDYDTPPGNFKRNNYFIKLHPWEYECEFRIVIRLKNKTKTKKDDRIKIKIDDIVNKLEFYLAPEVVGRAKQGEISKGNKARIELQKAHKGNNLTIKKSELNINMDLLNKNKQSIAAYVVKKLDS